MRLLTYDHDGRPRAGAQVGSHVVSIADVVTFARDGNKGTGSFSTRTPNDFPASVIDLLAAGEDAKAMVEAAIRFVAAGDCLARLAERGAAREMDAVRFLPPVPRPGKIICIGQNYRAHVAEMKREMPKYPMFFAKFANTLVGHGGAIVLPRVSAQVDYEAELMIVVGRRCKNVPPDKAFDVIAGYTIFNDVSVRDYQRRTSQFLQGKTFDTTGPVGPVIVTADEIPDPENLRIRLRLNDETMQDSNTSDFIFDIKTIINYLSEIMTLEPGDLIATGTPGGVGSARDPQVFLKAGDTVEVEIENLGTLRNTVLAS